MSTRECVGKTNGYAVLAVVDAAGRAAVDDGAVVRDVPRTRAHANLLLRACRRAEQLRDDHARSESGGEVVELRRRPR